MLAGAAAGAPAQGSGGLREGKKSLKVFTFGDSILDSGRYNEHGIHPAQLLVRNDDRLFPAFRGQDLSSKAPTQLVHRAQDGATVDDLSRQVAGIRASEHAIALVTIGGNDLLRGLAGDESDGVLLFANKLAAFLKSLPIRPILLGTVYDPTFGDDSRNFLGVPARIARANLNRMNEALRKLAPRYGALADIHAHFLKGDPSWFAQTIEPSLRGALEVRRVFLSAALQLLPRAV